MTNNISVDLHLHTHFSDGVHAPETIMTMAAQAGVSTLAICDHDNLDGIAPARAAAVHLGIEVISGVELSSRWKSYEDLHILGYGFDPLCPELVAELAEFRAFRSRRNELIVERVNRRLATQKRAPLDFARVREAADGTLGRPHIARALIEKGYVRDTSEAFERYLIPCNVEKRFFPADQAIGLIHRAGGVAVLAHPPFITPDRPALERLLDALVAHGLDGLEAYNNGATRDDIDYLLTQARRRGLIATGGSDHHGFEGDESRIGWCRGALPIPQACAQELRAALARRAAG
ncbi:PHP domain-containing protein [Geoalkalibacter halelectricus]|uniref:PHP domain-containing protein n=1 Tax=Geoalkalibacter halelectricus TaxID=2847045 RepID=UPI003D25ED65